MPDFSELLSRPAASAERPKPKPQGTYHGQIKGHVFGESRQKKTPFVEFQVANISPSEDVDQSLLEDIDLTKWTAKTEFYLTEDSMFRLREFLESLGFDTKNKTFAELIPEATGQPVIFRASNSTSQDGSTVYTNIDEVMGTAGSQAEAA